MNPHMVSRFSLIGALLVFLLPFFSFSCGGQKVMSLSGVDLVTGVTVGADRGLGAMGRQQVEEERSVDPEPLAIVALAVGIVGLGATFIATGRARRVVPSTAGLIGVVALLLLYWRATREAAQQQVAVEINPEVGFWGSIILFGIAAVGGSWNSLTSSSGADDPGV